MFPDLFGSYFSPPFDPGRSIQRPPKAINSRPQGRCAECFIDRRTGNLKLNLSAPKLGLSIHNKCSLHPPLSLRTPLLVVEFTDHRSLGVRDALATAVSNKEAITTHDAPVHCARFRS
jgi:hypothetical protein